jgi:hypothetical protein
MYRSDRHNPTKMDRGIMARDVTTLPESVRSIMGRKLALLRRELEHAGGIGTFPGGAAGVLAKPGFSPL